MLGGGRRRIVFEHGFEEIISLDNLLESWKEFIKGKRKRKDVQEFSLNLMDNILELHQDLTDYTYRHGPYQAFRINDPKPRQIHKATVSDRLLHHATYRLLYPFFDRIFIADSFSCRNGKGTHKAINRFRQFSYQVSKNNTRACWVLKCDIKKFFENIDHEVLLNILAKHISNKDILWLLKRIVCSFSSSFGRGSPIGLCPRGLPLGNLTSQLFVNIYMNEFDQFMKHRIRAKCYLRYADDFVIISDDKPWLEEILPKIGNFLSEQLCLTLHPNKVSIETLPSGVDFLGWVHFFDHRVLRTATKKRMMRNLKNNTGDEILQSYLGLLKHGNAQKLKKKLKI